MSSSTLRGTFSVELSETGIITATSTIPSRATYRVDFVARSCVLLSSYLSTLTIATKDDGLPVTAKITRSQGRTWAASG